jgi:hypothetical protein
MKKLILAAVIAVISTIAVYSVAELKGSPFGPATDGRFDDLETDGEGDRVASKVCVAKYDFAVDAGAIGSINIGCKVPDNAIVTNVWYDILTAFVSTSGGGTVALGSEASGDLLAAVDADTLSGQGEGIPDWATEGDYVKTTAQKNISLAIASEAMTAGKAIFYINYMVSE